VHERARLDDAGEVAERIVRKDSAVLFKAGGERTTTVSTCLRRAWPSSSGPARTGRAGSQQPDQPHRQADPCRVVDHLLAQTDAERQQVEHGAVATDEATEDEAAGGAGDEHVA